MDRWRFLDIVHADHDFLNPISDEGFATLTDALELSEGRRVLDVACGTGEMLVRWALACGIRGIGVDASLLSIRRAEASRAARAPDSHIEFRHARGETLVPEELGRFDVACLVGASWIWGGWSATLDAMLRFATPGGILVLGDPHWLLDPPPEYLRAEGLKRADFLSLGQDLEAARSRGLQLVTMVGSSLDDWDRYEMLQARALDRFARQHPDDPDLAQMRSESDASRRAYLHWGRTTVGFATWVFRVPS